MRAITALSLLFSVLVLQLAGCTTGKPIKRPASYNRRELVAPRPGLLTGRSGTFSLRRNSYDGSSRKSVGDYDMTPEPKP